MMLRSSGARRPSGEASMMVTFGWCKLWVGKCYLNVECRQRVVWQTVVSLMSAVKRDFDCRTKVVQSDIVPVTSLVMYTSRNEL